jgi:hypothetical protein
MHVRGSRRRAGCEDSERVALATMNSARDDDHAGADGERSRPAGIARHYKKNSRGSAPQVLKERCSKFLAGLRIYFVRFCRALLQATI